MTTAVAIPAYDPDHKLIQLIEGLLAYGLTTLIVVDDGSGPESRKIIEQACARPGVVLLTHEVNMGKGAALKTAMKVFLERFPDYSGLVTVDADGQHAPEDVLAVSQALDAHPGELVLGVRVFSSDIPLKSFVGNTLTRTLTRWLIGLDIADTQTGLRGIPTAALPELMTIPFNHYEFEMEMLIRCKRMKIAMFEQPIKVIYIDGNASSHFNPLVDSMRIYLTLFRYTLAGLSTAAIDYLIFWIAYNATHQILVSTYCARAVSLVYNYLVVRRLVFHTTRSFWRTFPSYLALVVISGFLSATLTQTFSRDFLIPILLAKVAAEMLLYVLNFVIQRRVIFQEGEW